MMPRRSRKPTLRYARFKRDANFAVDQPDRQIARFGAVDRRFHFGAGLDAELFGEPPLERRKRKVRGDEAGLALTDHLKRSRSRNASGLRSERKLDSQSSTATASNVSRSRIERTASALARETCAVPSSTNSTSPRRTRAMG